MTSKGEKRLVLLGIRRKGEKSFTTQTDSTAGEWIKSCPLPPAAALKKAAAEIADVNNFWGLLIHDTNAG
jgi:hypothetical protein